MRCLRILLLATLAVGCSDQELLVPSIDSTAVPAPTEDLTGPSLGPAVADPPDVMGRWYGTWELTTGWSSNFSMDISSSPYGLLAVMYVPELGLFNETLPAVIEDGPDGRTVSIGVEPIVEIWGLLDGESISGAFYATVPGGALAPYTGIWQAQKQTEQTFLPQGAPGPECDALPPLYCIGDSEYCSELIQFDPTMGEGYVDFPVNGETWDDQYRSFIRRDLMMLIGYASAKVACKATDWNYGSSAPLGLVDMSEADGSIPGTSIGYPAHPSETHEDGKDIDTAYYQLYAADNKGRPVGVHFEGVNEAYHLLEPPYGLDRWRTALFVAFLAEHPRLRVVGVDGQIGMRLEETFDELSGLGWLALGVRETIPLAYETEDTGRGWFRFHHHHMHVSINPVHSIVSSFTITPSTLNRKSKGKYITAYIEFDEGVDLTEVNEGSVALLIDGHTMLPAHPDDIKISDFDGNGIEDITVKFDRQEVIELVENGDIELSISGSVGPLFFQESESLRVMKGDEVRSRRDWIRQRNRQPNGRNKPHG